MEILPQYIAFGFLRVSGTKQALSGESLDQQKEIIIKFAKKDFNINPEQILFLKVADSSSKYKNVQLDFRDQPVERAIQIATKYPKQFKYLFILSINRFTRGGETIYEKNKLKLRDLGVKIFDTEGKITNKVVNDPLFDKMGVDFSFSKEEESLDLEMQEARNARIVGQTNVKNMFQKNVTYILNGWFTGPAPFGFITSNESERFDPSSLTGRCVLLPHPQEAIFITEIFRLRVEGLLNDEEIVKRINNMGYKSRIKKKHDKDDPLRVVGTIGGVQLTVKRMQEYVTDVTYAGVNDDKWLSKNAIPTIGPAKYNFPGLVSIETFNKANRNKVKITELGPEFDNEFQKGGRKVKIEYDIPDWQLKKNTEKDEYPYKGQSWLVCPICGHQLRGSAPKGKYGKPHPRYHCKFGDEHKNRNPKEYGIKRSVLHQAVFNYFEHLEFSEEFKKQLTQKVLARIYDRRKGKVDISIRITKQILQWEEEKKTKLEAIKLAYQNQSLPVIIKDMEKDYSDLDEKIRQADADKSRIDEIQKDDQFLVKQIIYFVEHLKELLIDRKKEDGVIINCDYFPSIFEVPPTPQNFIDGTPKLNRLFALNEDFKRLSILSCAQERT